MNVFNWSPNNGDGITLGSDARLIVGNAIGAVPTKVEVNGTSYLNQIIGAINYKKSVLGIGSPLSYILNTAHGVKTSTLDTIKTAINSIRSLEGLSVYPFTNLVAGTTHRDKEHLTELRQALDVGSYNVVINDNGLGANDGFVTLYKPWPTIWVTAIQDSGINNGFIGKFNVSHPEVTGQKVSTTLLRTALLSSASSATLTLLTTTSAPAEPFTLEIWTNKPSSSYFAALSLVGMVSSSSLLSTPNPVFDITSLLSSLFDSDTEFLFQTTEEANQTGGDFTSITADAGTHVNTARLTLTFNY